MLFYTCGKELFAFVRELLAGNSHGEVNTALVHHKKFNLDALCRLI